MSEEKNKEEKNREETSESIQKHIQEIHRRCRQSHVFHYAACRYYTHKNNLLGIITIILSSVASSALLAQIVQNALSLQTTYSKIITFGAGVLSIVVTVLTISQMFLSYSGLAEKCKSISAGYGGVKREIELLLSLVKDGKINEVEIRIRMDNINSTLTNLAKEAPLIPKDIEKKVKNDLESDPIHHELFS